MKSQREKAEMILGSKSFRNSNLGSISDGMAPIMDAVVLSTIASYAQGMEILKLASDEYNYNLHMPSIAQIWKGGCIIRSTLLKRIQDAFNRDSQLPNLLIDPWFAGQVKRRLPGLTSVVSVANQAGIPVPCFSSTLDYINSYSTSRLPQNLVQAMRDCFGSHTYERIDKTGAFHTDWIN